MSVRRVPSTDSARYSGLMDHVDIVCCKQCKPDSSWRQPRRMPLCPLGVAVMPLKTVEIHKDKCLGTLAISKPTGLKHAPCTMCLSCFYLVSFKISLKGALYQGEIGYFVVCPCAFKTKHTCLTVVDCTQQIAIPHKFVKIFLLFCYRLSADLSLPRHQGYRDIDQEYPQR